MVSFWQKISQTDSVFQLMLGQEEIILHPYLLTSTGCWMSNWGITENTTLKYD